MVKTQCVDKDEVFIMRFKIFNYVIMILQTIRVPFIIDCDE